MFFLTNHIQCNKKKIHSRDLSESYCNTIKEKSFTLQYCLFVCLLGGVCI